MSIGFETKVESNDFEIKSKLAFAFDRRTTGLETTPSVESL